MFYYFRNTLKEVRIQEFILLSIILILIFLLRLPSSFNVVIDWDESVYFIVAQDILDGGLPYKTSWDHKGPILYFLFYSSNFSFR